MQQGNKDQIQKQMQKMKNNTEDINKTLDQQLQLYKQLEVEKKLNEAVKDLRDLSLELQQNAVKTNDKNQNKDKLKQEQQKIQDKYNQIKEDLKELQKLNQELEDPTKFKSTEELQKDADQQLQQGSPVKNCFVYLHH